MTLSETIARRTSTRWNISSVGKRCRDADGFVVSIPKSGRTWLRVLFCAYACKAAGVEVRVEKGRMAGLPGPYVFFSHDLWEHRTARVWDRLRGRFLLAGSYLEKPIVLLARDPRDVIVSLHFQLSKREGRFEGSLSEFLRDGRYGLERVVLTMNHWWAEWGGRDSVLLVRYEDCRADPARELRRMLEHVGFEDVDDAAVEAAIEYARFENMQRLERGGGFDAGKLRAALRPADAADPDSFKVRRGKIGGYRDYMSEEDQAYAKRVCGRLDPAYGYSDLGPSE